MSRIFLSHSSKDNFEAIAIKNWLAIEGWNDVFLDLDPKRGIAAGERWEQALSAAANRCEAVIFLVSQNWLDSGWCMREYSLARGLNKKLFAVLIDRTKTAASLPAELTGVWQIVNLLGGQDHQLFATRLPGEHQERHIALSQSGLVRLKRGLEKAGLSADFFPWPPESDVDRAPYRGLTPLEAPDAGIYFGRDALIVEAIDKIRGLRAGAAPRLMVILGASGAGKSSFLRAGLLPRLQRDDAQFLTLLPLRPNGAAITGETGLINALNYALPLRTRAEVRVAVGGGSEPVLRLLKEVVGERAAQRDPNDAGERPPAIVVAVDQAEELFRSEGRGESDALLELLVALARNAEIAMLIIFTIRSDAYELLQSSRPLEGLQQTALPLSPLPRSAYRSVIEGPARRLEEAGEKLRIEPELVEKLLLDIEVGTGDALPLLAFTLQQLYLDYRRAGTLRLRDYQAFGGLKGAIDAAISRAFSRAEQLVPSDQRSRERLLRRGLIPWLASVDPETKSVRRNSARSSDIPSDALPLLDLLVEERLLSRDVRTVHDHKSGQKTRQTVIEPTHEALLRRWDLLDRWLKEDFALLTTLEAVKRAAADWDANERGDSWVIHQGQRLIDARAVTARPDLTGRFDPTDLAYLAVAFAREEASRVEAEQRRREREETQRQQIESANKLAAAANTLAHSERRTARRTRVGASIALVLAVAAALFGWYGQVEKKRADQQSAQANVQRAAAEVAKSYAQSQRDIADKAAQDAKAQRDTAEQAKQEAVTQTALADRRAAEATREKNNAEAARREAEEQRGIASESSRLAVRRGSAALVALATAQVDSDPIRAAKLALGSWPRNKDDSITPKLPEALDVLAEALSKVQKPVTITGSGGFAEFSPDGKYIIIDLGKTSAQIWDVARGRQFMTLQGHNDTVNSGAFSADSRRIVTASDDKTARIWDSVSGHELFMLQGHTDQVNSAVFNMDGTRVVSTSQDRTARIWDASTGHLLTTITIENEFLRSAIFSPNGTHVLTIPFLDTTVRLWDAKTGKALASLGHTDWVTTAVYSPDGSRILTASGDKTARVWDAETGKLLLTLNHSDAVQSAAFSPDGSTIVTACHDKNAYLWEASSGERGKVFRGHTETLVDVIFSNDGQRIITTSDDNTAIVWDVASGRAIDFLTGHQKKIFSAKIDRNGTHIATVSDDGTTRLWSTELARPDFSFGPKELWGRKLSLLEAGFDSSQTRVVTVSESNFAEIWDVRKKQMITTIPAHNKIYSAYFNTDGTKLVTVSRDKTAKLWDTATGRLLQTFVGHTGSVRFANFAPSGKYIVTSSDDKTSIIWEVASGRSLVVLSGHEDAVTMATFSPDGSRVLSVSRDKTGRIWDAASGLTLKILQGHVGPVSSGVFSPDGSLVLTASQDSTARLWDVKSGVSLFQPLEHSAAISSAQFSPDGTRAITTSEDKTARVWDVATGHRLMTLAGHSDAVNSAAFSRDGSRVVTASSDSDAWVWDAISGKRLAVLRGHLGAVTSAAFTEDGESVVTASVLGTARLWDLTALPKGNILQVSCDLLTPDKTPVSLAGIIEKSSTGQDTICVPYPPPPDITYE